MNESPGLLGSLLPSASDRQLHKALRVLAQATARYPHIQETLIELVARHPERIGACAVTVATQAADPSPLLAALRPLISRKDLSFETLAAISGAVPAQSRVLGSWAVELSEAMLQALGWPDISPASANSGEALATLMDLIPRLLAVDRPDAAETVSEAIQQTWSRSADTQLETPGLPALPADIPAPLLAANYLMLRNHVRSLLYQGQALQALPVISELVDRCRQLAESGPEAYPGFATYFRAGLANAHEVHASCLAAVNRAEEAIQAG